MADKIWIDSHWYFDYASDSWTLTGPGAYLIAEKPDILVELRGHQVESLIVALDKEGWIKPRLDERLRVEDLKITHRLLDIIDNQFKKVETKENKT